MAGKKSAISYQQPEGIKLSVQISPDVSDEYLQFLQQMGINYCYTWVNDEQACYEFLRALKQRTERFGIRIYNVGTMNLGKSEAILLGKEDRCCH